MRFLIGLLVVLLSAVVVTVGCQRSGDRADTNVVITGGGGTGDARYLLTDEPAGAKGVIELKKDAMDGDEILVVGRVGGSKKPFLVGHAGFTIVDPSLKQCSERPGDNCDTPWDYCCENTDDLKRATVLVKFVDERGKTLEGDARELLGVEPLQTVVVKGKAKRDDAGNVTVLASAMHVRKN